MQVRRGSLDPPTGSGPPRVRGRADLIAALAVWCQAPDERVHVLSGLGGSGKTTVALALAEQATSSGVRVWWLTVRDRRTLTNDLLDLLVDLGATTREIRRALSGERSLVDLVWRYLDTPARPWLLVLDNADEPDLLAADGGRVGDGNGVARRSRYGLVVVTSRVASVEVWGSHAVVHRVDSLAIDDAAHVLCDLAPHAGSEVEAAALAARLGGLPLALRAAGRYLRSTQAQLDGVATFAGYLRILNVEGLHGATGRGPRQPRAVLEATWEASLELLTRQGLPQARAVMRLLGGFAAAPVPASVIDGPALFHSRLFAPAAGSAGGRRWFASISALVRRSSGLPGYDAAAHRDTIAALCQLGLLDIEVAAAGADQTVCLVAHPLVTEVNAAWLAAHPNIGRTVHATVIALLAQTVRDRHAHDAVHYRLWPLIVTHLSQALAVADVVSSADLLKLLAAANATSWGLLRAGHPFTGHSLATATAEASARRLPTDHPQHLAARRHIASALIELGRYREAGREFAVLVPARTRVLGAEHRETLATRMSQAKLLRLQGRYEEAEAEFQAVYTIQRRVLGDDGWETLLTGSNIGLTLAQRGCYEQAETQYRTVLTRQQRTLGERHSNTLVTRQNIADLLTRQQRYEQAEAQYRAVLAVDREVLGPEHPWTLDAHHGLAEVLVHRGAHEQAETEFRVVLVTRTRVLGHDHPDTLTSRYWLAEVLARRGQRTRAIAELHTVLADQERTLEPHHPDLQRTLATIDRWEKAEGSGTQPAS